ncbi:hypothetical protein [Salinimicrobium sp. WS361]|uniref:hypothetical protein n=1 Tax=Salinimicrobium sp. WS361 TaxID=3425123 RepID=UPI003D6F8014
MKKIIFFFLPLILFSCKEAESSSTVKEQQANFDWLLGDWERQNEQENRSTFESWAKSTNSEV